ncbi:RagB/SusD family nutrient uptake outer membrane protein [Maribacter dokdonensis]|uniref:RagB/SusD family nutrient uptake outer membrane protein n=1 Tax=Maribacter dokdonensis TaxID=320912 RepID=UPI002AB153C2|nr:RagB/SusD family nutrient uptake outer membrane protein [Maribacter dokdonensis]
MKFLPNIKYSYLCLGALFVFGSCEKYIEEDIFSDLTSESFVTQENADQLVVGIYGELRDVYQNYTYQFLGTDIFTIQPAVFSVNSANDYVGLSSGFGGEVWSDNYAVVAKANTAINRYENQIDFNESYLDDKAYGIAQAKALRALAFFNLVQQYGGVVIDLEEPSAIRSDYTRSTEEETYTQIISDLESAIPDLLESPDTGRFSKKAAQHLLADVYLTRGYSSFGSNADFVTAATLAEEAIGSYDIRSQSFAEVFDYNNQINDEILFSVQWGNGGDVDDRNNNKHSLFINAVNNYDGISRANLYGLKLDLDAMPTPFFYSLFNENDSREDVTIHRALFANEEATVTSDFGTDNVAVGDTVIYYPKQALDADELADKLNRYYVYQPDQYLFGVPENVEGVIYQYTSNLNRTNFPIFKKFQDVGFDGNVGGSRDTFVFRVAGTHLIAAEAHLAAGNTASALNHLNIVRERATGVANEYTSITIDDILNERAIELAGEVNRWAVLKRTGKLEERIELFNPHVMDHGVFDQSVHKLRPIPAIELQLSEGFMEQNPGY